ncbi:MAG: serine hydrolase domain-containing protein [Bacteroidota bacterium]
MLKNILTVLLIVFQTSVLGQELTQKLDSYLLTTAKNKNKFNGTVLVAQNGRILLNKGYGYKNKVEQVYNDTSTIYQIGSITKTFTSAIILRLQDEKMLSLTDKISKYIVDYPDGDDITIESLLTHTSGIFEYLESKEYAKENFIKPISIDTLISFFKSQKRLFKSGQRFSYTNSGYILLAFIVEKVTGKKYEQVVRDVIFEPLQMIHSGFDLRNLSDTNKAINYDNISKKRLISEPVFDSTHAPGCGNIYSTAIDLYKWDRALYGNKILRQSSLQKAYIPYKSKYGYGWFIDKSYGKFNVFHGGGTPGFHSNIQRFINDDVCIILLSNNAYCDLSEITNRLAAIIFNKPYETLQF